MTKKLTTLFVVLSVALNGLYYSHFQAVVSVLALIIILIKYKENKALKLTKDMSFVSLFLLFLVSFTGTIYFVEKGMTIFLIHRYLLYILSYILFTNLSEEEKKTAKDTFTFLLVLISALNLLLFNLGVLELFYYKIDGELSGILQYANSYALLLVAGIVILFSYKRKIKYIGILILLSNIVLSASKGGIIALIFVLAIMMTRRIVKGKKNLKYLYISVFIVTLGLIIDLLWLKSITTYLYELFTSSGFLTRILYDKDALKAFKMHPFGFGYYGYFFAQGFFATGYDYTVKYVHNSLIQILLDLGIIGLMAHILFIISVLKKRMNAEKKLIIITILLHSLFDFDLQYPLFMLIIIFLVSEKIKVIVIKKPSFFGILFSSALLLSVYIALISGLYYNDKYEQVLKVYPFYTSAKKKLVSEMSNDELKVLVSDNEYIWQGYERMYYHYLKEGDYENALLSIKKMNYYNPLRGLEEGYYPSMLLAIIEWEYDDELADDIIGYDTYLKNLKKAKDTSLKVKNKKDFSLNDNHLALIERARRLKELSRGYYE